MEHPHLMEGANLDGNQQAVKPSLHTGMTTNRTLDPGARASALGEYLKLCRARLLPADVGISTGRRRTPGLRREELAQRAAISVTWYTWLEQGRGGGPSQEVLGRIAQALLLNEVEKEHLFLLAFGPSSAPALGFPEPELLSRLQRVLDAFTGGPAYVKTRIWNLVAWNAAANAVFGYDRLATHDCNLLRRMFLLKESKRLVDDWESVASFVVSTFRRELARSTVDSDTQALIEELCQGSADFRRLWSQHEVSAHGVGIKRLRLPTGGRLELEYAAFAIEGSPDLTMVVFNPVAATDARIVERLIIESTATGKSTQT